MVWQPLSVYATRTIVGMVAKYGCDADETKMECHNVVTTPIRYAVIGVGVNDRIRIASATYPRIVRPVPNDCSHISGVG